jgi:outer membrane protein assembly factor BamB
MAAFFAAACLTLPLGGCGGSGTTTSTEVPPSSVPGASSSTSTVTSSPSSTSTASTLTSTTTSTTSSASAADWSTFHHDSARSGVASDQLPMGRVRKAWVSARLDGAPYAQPLVAGNHVFVATEANSVYALDAASGSIVWQTNLGSAVPGGDLPCGNIDPSGITGTPLIDYSTQSLFVVAFLKTGPHHELFALDLSTGATKWHRTIDPPGKSPLVEQERGALALTAGRIYVPFGGLLGDCGQYQGALVSVAADGSGPLASYLVPTSRMAGIWNPAGPVVDANGDLWVGTGNSASRSNFDFGNALIRFSPQLEVVDYFAPADWAALNARDLDLNSLGPVLLPNERALVIGKNGTAYLLDVTNLGHIGGGLGSASIGSSPFGAAAIMDSMVYVPCSGALVALEVAQDQISVVWRVSGGSGSPIVAAGQIWSLRYDGRLMAFDLASGATQFTAQLTAPASRFFSPAAAGGRLFVADGNSIAAFSLR